MTAPPIVSGFTPAALVPYVLAAATAWLFWTRVVPRQLRGLQVAFQTVITTQFAFVAILLVLMIFAFSESVLI